MAGRPFREGNLPAPRKTMFLADRLRDMLAARGWTQTDLAERAGLTHAAVNRYVNGRREPRAETVAAIAEALDVNPADLIGDWGYIDEGALESVGRAVDLVVAHIDDLTLAQREAIALALARRA